LIMETILWTLLNELQEDDDCRVSCSFSLIAQ
jgi:hypothetical protein